MKLFCTFFVILIGIVGAQGAFAQDVTPEPNCFRVKNTAAYKVYGSIVTDYYTRPDGIRARHRSNFRLEEAGAVDEEKGYPLDVAEFCSYGPFYPGKKLEFVIRTLIPVFSCITKIDQGDIVISGRRNDDDTGNITTAACFE